MRRKIQNQPTKKENRQIDRFILEVSKLCKRHKMCITSNDPKVELLIKDYSDKNLIPLRDAIDGMKAVIKEDQTADEKYKKTVPKHQTPIFSKPQPITYG